MKERPLTYEQGLKLARVVSWKEALAQIPVVCLHFLSTLLTPVSLCADRSPVLPGVLGADPEGPEGSVR